MTRYERVDEGDYKPEQKGIVIMSDEILTIIRDIEALRRERIQDQSLLTSAFTDLTNIVSDLTKHLNAKVSQLEGKLQPISSRFDGMATRIDLDTRLTPLVKAIEEKPSANQIRGVVMNCVLDSSNPLCRRISLIETRLEQGEPKAEEEIRHETADEYLSCPECRGRFVKAARRIPEFEDAVLEGMEAGRLAGKLKESGFAVTEPPKSIENW